jgi:diguanylate cyclase (GGDEF)-like protein
MIARYGGEEIIAILVGGNRTEAAAAATRILKSVADLGIAHGGSTTRPYLTVSVGVATVEPGEEYSHERAVRLADMALYRTKERGRDGWSFHEEPAGAEDAATLLKTAS